jgi:hypothetical protein
LSNGYLNSLKVKTVAAMKTAIPVIEYDSAETALSVTLDRISMSVPKIHKN